LYRKYFISTLLLFVFLSSVKLNAQENGNQADSLSSKEKIIHFTIRIGQGGFTDARSTIGKLGGGQLSLDIKLETFPVALSISGESYTNSPDPTNSYEIANLTAVNLLYMKKLFKTERVNFFAGGGIGRLEVPKGENEPDTFEKGIMYNTEVGINTIVFWKIGVYGIYKYLYARNDKLIDFNEHIGLLGITFNFSLQALRH
jgi:hypothetical protein